MADRIRFHLDEQVDPIVAKALRRHGVDVTTTVDAGLLGQLDEVHLRLATEQRRVLVTHDADFLRLAGNTPGHSGIAYCHLTARSMGEIIRRLILIWEVLTPEEMTDAVEFL